VVAGWASTAGLSWLALSRNYAGSGRESEIIVESQTLM
jgi:hypothetical protein